MDALLNFELEELGEIDFLDESEESGIFLNPEEITAPQEKQEFQSLIRSIPEGKKGHEALRQTPIIGRLDKNLEKSKNIIPLPPPFETGLTQLSVSERDMEYKADTSRFYKNTLQKLQILFQELFKGNHIQYDRFSEEVGQILEIFSRDRAILQNMAIFFSPQSGFLPFHFLRLSIISMSIAASAKFNREQVQQIGETALIAHIGKTLQKGKLNLQKSAIPLDTWNNRNQHLIGIHILDRIKNIPEYVLSTAYQLYKMANGFHDSPKPAAVYPDILAVADAFNLYCEERARRNAFNPGESLKQVRNRAMKGRLSKSIVRHLIGYLSAFPVGSPVKLNSGQIAKVVEANIHAPLQPVISILNEQNGALLSEHNIYQIDLKEQHEITISKPIQINLDSFAPMNGF